MKKIHVIISFLFFSCGAGFSDFTTELPGGYKYSYEGEKAEFNSILDSNNFIKYSGIREISHDKNTLVFCQELEVVNIVNDSVLRKKRFQYFIYLEKTDTWFKNMSRKRYKEVFDSLALPKKLALK